MTEQLSALDLREARRRASQRAGVLEWASIRLRQGALPNEERFEIKEILLQWGRESSVSDEEYAGLEARIESVNLTDDEAAQRLLDMHFTNLKGYAEHLRDAYPEAFDPERLLSHLLEWVQENGRSPEPAMLARELKFVLGEMRKMPRVR